MRRWIGRGGHPWTAAGAASAADCRPHVLPGLVLVALGLVNRTVAVLSGRSVDQSIGLPGRLARHAAAAASCGGLDRIGKEVEGA